ncbi:MAG: HEPN domain-containing protein [Acidobacteriota bacterium]
MSDVEALLVKATQSLDAARGLLRDGHPDFAASRGYYAMFYVAEALLAALGQSYNRHSAVIAAFGREYAKTGKFDVRFHQWLIAAQNFRNIGDYGIEAHVSKAQAESICTWVKKFIQAAQVYVSKTDVVKRDKC